MIAGESEGQWAAEGFRLMVDQPIGGEVTAELRLRLTEWTAGLVLMSLETDTLTPMMFVQDGARLDPASKAYIARPENMADDAVVVSGDRVRSLVGDESSTYHTMRIRIEADGRTAHYRVDGRELAVYRTGKTASRLRSVNVAFQSGLPGRHRADAEFLRVDVEQAGGSRWHWP